MPLVDIKPLTLTEKEIQGLSCSPVIDWFIFISANAVNFALMGNNGKIRDYFNTAKIAAIGQATANALQQAGLVVNVLPEQGFNSEALLAAPEFQNLPGQRCIIVRGVGGRELLAETLHSRGAQVDYLEVYERIDPLIDTVKLMELLQWQALDAIVITSAEALQNVFAQLPLPFWQEKLFTIPLVVISERLGLIASSLGFKRIIVSNGVSDGAVFKTIKSLVSGEYSG